MQPLAPPCRSFKKRGVQRADLSATAHTPGRAQAAPRLFQVHSAPHRTAAASSSQAFVDLTESF